MLKMRRRGGMPVAFADFEVCLLFVTNCTSEIVVNLPSSG